MNCVSGITLRGVEALPVEVEVVASGGMFSISVVGLPDAAVREARERVRAALRALGVTLRGHISINLAPADVPKEGALLDLAMAVSVASTLGETTVAKPSIIIGELALDGRLGAARRQPGPGGYKGAGRGQARAGDSRGRASQPFAGGFARLGQDHAGSGA